MATDVDNKFSFVVFLLTFFYCFVLVYRTVVNIKKTLKANHLNFRLVFEVSELEKDVFVVKIFNFGFLNSGIIFFDFTGDVFKIFKT